MFLHQQHPVKRWLEQREARKAFQSDLKAARQRTRYYAATARQAPAYQSPQRYSPVVSHVVGRGHRPAPNIIAFPGVPARQPRTTHNLRRYR